MAEQEMEIMAPGAAVVPYNPREHAVSLIVEDFDVALITAGVNEDVIDSWCYCFRQGGATGEVILGLSVKGVQAVVREMSKRGEVVRMDPPVQAYEDADEIRLVGTAQRFFVSGDGVEVETDRTVRALRQEKMQKVNDWGDGPGGRRVVVGSHLVQDAKWYEKAYSKAVRNCMLPLLRPDAVSVVMNAFKNTQKYLDVVNNVRPTAARSASTRSQNQQRDNAQPAQQSRAQPQPHPAPNTPISNAAPDPRTLQQIIDVMKDLKDTMGPRDYGIIYREVVDKYGPAAGGKQFPQTILLQHTAELCLAELRRLRGDPPPEEDVNMTQETITRERETITRKPAEEAPDEAAEEKEEAEDDDEERDGSDDAPAQGEEREG